MINSQDKKNLEKSTHAANFLVQDLLELTKSDNPLLADIAQELLQQAIQIELRLKRINSITAS
jgi:hypothetical protein